MAPDERPARKDRLIQTRVPRQLETSLKDEARRRRLTVSHLIRNVLEESLQLVDGVVADVDQIVSDSVKLARNVTRGAVRVAAASRPSEITKPVSSEPEPAGREPTGPEAGSLDHIYAWNEVTLHRAAACSGCGAGIARGETGHAGLSDDPSRPRAWLCATCIQSLE